MHHALLPAAILSLVAFTGMVGLRSFAYPVRIAFDAACFAAISVAFYLLGLLPMFPPLQGEIDAGALLMRVAGGAWWLLGARLIVAGLWFLVAHDRRSREARLVFDLSAAAIYGSAAAIMLASVFALPVTGLIATSGAIAILLGLALQNTLADVFAGIAVGIEAPFRIGDNIRVGDRAEGEVVQINWRSIHVLTEDDSVAVLPNSLVAKSDLVNRSSPAARSTVAVELGHPAEVAPELVIEKLREAILLLPEAMPRPAPRVLLAELGGAVNGYSVRFSVETAATVALARDRFLRSARRQLAALGFDAGNASAEPESAGPSGVARLLRGLALMEPLDDAEVVRLAAAVERCRFEPGEVLFAEGDGDSALWIVASGVVEVARAAGAGRDVLGSVGAGDYLGEIALLSGNAHAATATARSHTLAFRVSGETLGPLLAANPALSAALERSARRGLELLHRQVAVRAAEGQMRGPFARMRGLFQSAPPQGSR